MRRCFLSVWLLFVLAGSACAGEAVSLKTYMDMVERGNNALQRESRSVEAAYYELLASVAYQRPSVSISASGSYLSGQEQAGSKERDQTAYNVSLSLNHIIDITGKYSLDEQQQILLYEAKQANFFNVKNSILASAEEKYWTAVLARDNVRLQRDVLHQRLQNKKITDQKYQQQLVPKLDTIRADSLVVQAQSLITEAEARYNNILADMSAMAGGKSVVVQEEPLEIPAFDVTATLEKAFLNRPDIKADQLLLKRAKVIKKLMAKGMAPTLEAGVNWVPFSDPWYSSSPQREEVRASLRLNIPLLDGNKSKYETLNADRLILAAEASIKGTENTARMELTVAKNNWEKAFALEIDTKSQVERSNEELRITWLMYQEGLGAQIDLINAQTENQRVRTQYLDAVKEMHLALVQLHKAVGDYSHGAAAEEFKPAPTIKGRGDVKK